MGVSDIDIDIDVCGQLDLELPGKDSGTESEIADVPTEAVADENGAPSLARELLVRFGTAGVDLDIAPRELPRRPDF